MKHDTRHILGRGYFDCVSLFVEYPKSFWEGADQKELTSLIFEICTILVLPESLGFAKVTLPIARHKIHVLR